MVQREILLKKIFSSLKLLKAQTTLTCRIKKNEKFKKKKLIYMQYVLIVFFFFVYLLCMLAIIIALLQIGPRNSSHTSTSLSFYCILDSNFQKSVLNMSHDMILVQFLLLAIMNSRSIHLTENIFVGYIISTGDPQHSSIKHISNT